MKDCGKLIDYKLDLFNLATNVDEKWANEIMRSIKYLNMEPLFCKDCPFFFETTYNDGSIGSYCEEFGYLEKREEEDEIDDLIPKK